jgi:predicted peroxiredoxin
LKVEEDEMSDEAGKVVVNLATGHEDADRVTVAFLVATAALERERPVAMFATKEAVRLGIPGYAQAIESAGAPPVGRLFDQFFDRGGELLLCPICFRARALDEQAVVPGARIAGATPLWEWIGDKAATVFSY